MGTKTMIMLDEQGEQLNRIEEGAEQVNEAMREAEKHLYNMEKCCGLCVMPWRKHKSLAKSDESKKTWQKSAHRIESRMPITSTDVSAATATGSRSAGVANQTYFERITNDDREDEMEENLSSVAKMVGNLKNMSLDMGQVLEAQNRQIDRVQDKTSTIDLRIKKGVQRTQDILRKA